MVRIELSPPVWATHLVSDLTDWNREPLPVANLEPLELPDDSYFEYAWLDGEGNRRADPDNENPRLNPWWPYACHIAGPRYTPDPYLARAKRPTLGRVMRMIIDSTILGEQRRLLVYSPPGHGESKLPWIVFQDGMAFFGWGRAAQVMDMLLADGKIEPAHLIFLPPRQRTVEYAFNAEYRRFVCEEVIPTIARRVPWDGRATAWGASLGGLLSSQLAWERPDIFQQVVSQSGAFQFSPDMDYAWPFGGTEAFLGEVQGSPDPLPQIKWYLECGTLEWLLASNVNLAGELSKRAQTVKLITRPAGHNWVNWGNGVAAGLMVSLGCHPTCTI